MELFELIQTLVAAHGPSGDEGGIRECITSLVAEYADEIKTDTLGNLIVHKKGSGPKAMFAAHMDSIGFIVTHIEDDGFLRVAPIGGINPASVLGTSVTFKNGVRGVFVKEEKSEISGLKMDSCCLDIGAENKEEAAEMVQVGDTAVYATPTFRSRNKAYSPYLDDRIACAILVETLRNLKDTDNDLYFVFTVQEEVGLRGAQTAAWGIAPDYGIALDVTFSDDSAGSAKHGTTQLGKGAAIKLMDGGIICHPTMVGKLTSLAENGKIDAQKDIIRAGRTDAGPIHLTQSGVCTGGISIPCRYMHSPCECVDLHDVESCIQLLSAFACSKLEPFKS